MMTAWGTHWIGCTRTIPRRRLVADDKLMFVLWSSFSLGGHFSIGSRCAGLDSHNEVLRSNLQKRRMLISISSVFFTYMIY